jgi:hypothetical protein
MSISVAINVQGVREDVAPVLQRLRRCLGSDATDRPTFVIWAPPRWQESDIEQIDDVFEVEILDAEWRGAANARVQTAAESADPERNVIKLVRLGWAPRPLGDECVLQALAPLAALARARSQRSSSTAGFQGRDARAYVHTHLRPGTRGHAERLRGPRTTHLPYFSHRPGRTNVECHVFHKRCARSVIPLTLWCLQKRWERRVTAEDIPTPSCSTPPTSTTSTVAPVNPETRRLMRGRR